MKHYIKTLFVLTAMLYAYGATQPPEEFNIIVEPSWKDLEQDAEYAKKFGGKWILAGCIIFKKRAQDKVHLDRIYLQWDGPKIDNLIGSLYTSESHEEFIPIQDNLVCDGCWNNNQQKLLFNFEEEQLLTFKNYYFLVLTVRDDVEPVLKKGKFNLVTTTLPEPFKECARNGQFCLQYHNNAQPTFSQNVRVAKR